MLKYGWETWEVHLRMREIFQQICTTHKTIILMHNIQSNFIVIIVKKCAEK